MEAVIASIGVLVTVTLGFVSWQYLRLSQRLQRVVTRPILLVRYEQGVIAAANIGRGPALRLRMDYVGKAGMLTNVSFEVMKRDSRVYSPGSGVSAIDLGEAARFPVPKDDYPMLTVITYMDVLNTLYVMTVEFPSPRSGRTLLGVEERTYPLRNWLRA